MLECNRINSNLNYNNIDENEDLFKNRWINNVNSYGIVVEPGDVINCESAAINTIGAASDTIEILGAETGGAFVDNKIGIDYTYYVNDTGDHLVKLPFTQSHTYMTYEPGTAADNPSTAGQVGPAARFTSSNVTRRKYMGMTKVAPFANGPTDVLNPNTLPSGEFFESEIPNGRYVYYYTLKKTPDAVSPHPVGQGFITGNVYSSINLQGVGPSDTSTAGYKFKMVNTINEPQAAGIPDKIELYDIPIPPAGQNDLFCRLGAPANVSGSKAQDIVMHSVGRPEFRTKRLTGPTGSRYYFSEFGYTGPTGGYIDATPDINFKPAELNPVFTLRTSKVIHQVPEGLNTPDNIATILTDQLHRPTRYKADTRNDYIDYSNMEAKFNNLRDEIQTGKPPLVETPSYTPMPCNYGTNSRKTTKVNSYVDSLAYYYSLIGWKFPERPMGMGWTLSLNYGKSNDDVRNQINSGTDQRAGPGVGDWSGMTFTAGKNNDMGIGGLGQTLTHMMDFQTEPNGVQPQQGSQTTPGEPPQPNKIVNKYVKGGWVVTNAYFTEAVLKRISDGLKKCELYMGDRSLNTDTTTQNYIDNQACVFDLGIYLDELSNDPANLQPMQEFTPKATAGNTPIFQPGTPKTFWKGYQPGQLKRINSSFEGSNITGGVPGDNYIQTDKGIGMLAVMGSATANNGAQAWASNNNQCCGTLPYNTAYSTYNNGQQLSSFIATSRWREEFVFDENNIDVTYQDCFDRLKIQGLLPGRAGDEFKTNNHQFGTGSNTLTQTFAGSYTDDDATIGKQTYRDLIALARKYDVACIPVFPPPLDPAENKGNSQDFNKFGGRPYVAFRSHMELGGSGTMEQVTYDPVKGGTDQKWQIDARNGGYGIQMGFDQSFTRNDCAMLFNTNFGNTQELATSAGYSPVVFMGASNPTYDFDTNLSRFTITGLNTPMTIGNGLPTQNQISLDPNPDPEQQCYNAMKSGQIATAFGGNNSIDFEITDGTPDEQGYYFADNPIPVLGQYVLQDSLSLIDSYTGLAINRLFLYDKDGNETAVEMTGLFGDGITKWKQDILDGTLFGKMGFKINQLLPNYGSAQATFNNPLTFETFGQSFEKKFLNTSKPQTTGAFISSAEYQPAETNDINLPYYGMGINVGKSARPSVTQASITAQTLPTKLDYPYLNIYSSIVQQGTDTEYYGGVDGKSRLPCIGYITRNYNEGDFFYGMEQGFSYTATKSFTLTEIQTDIRLPNGNRPRLQPHNSVIYKITKSTAPPTTGTKPPPQKKNNKSRPPQQKKQY